jgi:putative exporter of polyketide antibiotics
MLYGWAIAGIGFGVGGLWRSSAAGVAGIVVTAATLLLDVLVPVLRLPAWLRDLALTAHYGEPLVGNWNLLGVGVSLAVALGGLALGAWGFSRRDLKG